MSKPLTNKEVLHQALIIIISGIILAGVIWLATVLQTRNCWDQWHTESDAIQHCENHNTN
jgi:hypothetical protein